MEVIALEDSMSCRCGLLSPIPNHMDDIPPTYLIAVLFPLPVSFNLLPLISILNLALLLPTFSDSYLLPYSPLPSCAFLALMYINQTKASSSPSQHARTNEST
eukprot:238332-Hanusia_phi.AAC.2